MNDYTRLPVITELQVIDTIGDMTTLPHLPENLGNWYVIGRPVWNDGCPNRWYRVLGGIPRQHKRLVYLDNLRKIEISAEDLAVIKKHITLG